MMTEDEAREQGLTVKGDPGLLEELADLEGMDVEEMLENALMDGRCPGICKNGCGYTTDVEPDNAEGWCEFCQEGSVVSAMVLAGII